MIFHIAVCSPDPVLRGRVQRHCMEYYARRADACIVEQLESTAALLQQDFIQLTAMAGNRESCGD